MFSVRALNRIEKHHRRTTRRGAAYCRRVDYSTLHIPVHPFMRVVMSSLYGHAERARSRARCVFAGRELTVFDIPVVVLKSDTLLSLLFPAMLAASCLLPFVNFPLCPKPPETWNTLSSLVL